MRFRHGTAETVTLRVTGASPDGDDEARRARARAADPFVLLAHRRGGVWQPLAGEASLAEGDRIVAVVHGPERESALEALRDAGFEPAPDDDAPSDDAAPGANGEKNGG